MKVKKCDRCDAEGEYSPGGGLADPWFEQNGQDLCGLCYDEWLVIENELLMERTTKLMGFLSAGKDVHRLKTGESRMPA